jgi:hypothetical protein
MPEHQNDAQKEAQPSSNDQILAAKAEATVRVEKGKGKAKPDLPVRGTRQPPVDADWKDIPSDNEEEYISTFQQQKSTAQSSGPTERRS